MSFQWISLRFSAICRTYDTTYGVKLEKKRQDRLFGLYTADRIQSTRTFIKSVIEALTTSASIPMATWNRWSFPVAKATRFETGHRQIQPDGCRQIPSARVSGISGPLRQPYRDPGTCDSGHCLGAGCRRCRARRFRKDRGRARPDFRGNGRREDPRPQVGILYIVPTRALANDIENRVRSCPRQ